MKPMHSSLKILVPLIFILALAAALAGIWPSEGQPFAYTTLRGEEVTIHASGLYYWDTVSSAAQMQGNDLVTLVVGLPLLAISAWLAWRGSLRGRLLLTGALGFFLYTYISMSMLTAFNAFFLVYVALFALSLYAFILAMLSFDLSSLPGYFSPRLPRGWIAGLMFAVGAFLSVAWLGRVSQPLLQGTVAPLENTTTWVIQAMDLALITPLAVLSGILLLRRSAWGYLLASVTLLKGVTLGLGVSAMAINMALRGVAEDTAIMVPFLAITLANLVLTGFLLKNVQEPAATANY